MVQRAHKKKDSRVKRQMIINVMHTGNKMLKTLCIKRENNVVMCSAFEFSSLHRIHTKVM